MADVLSSADCSSVIREGAHAETFRTRPLEQGRSASSILGFEVLGYSRFSRRAEIRAGTDANPKSSANFAARVIIGVGETNASLEPRFLRSGRYLDGAIFLLSR